MLAFYVIFKHLPQIFRRGEASTSSTNKPMTFLFLSGHLNRRTVIADARCLHFDAVMPERNTKPSVSSQMKITKRQMEPLLLPMVLSEYPTYKKSIERLF